MPRKIARVQLLSNYRKKNRLYEDLRLALTCIWKKSFLYGFRRFFVCIGEVAGKRKNNGNDSGTGIPSRFWCREGILLFIDTTKQGILENPRYIMY